MNWGQELHQELGPIFGGQWRNVSRRLSFFLGQLQSKDHKGPGEIWPPLSPPQCALISREFRQLDMSVVTSKRLGLRAGKRDKLVMSAHSALVFHPEQKQTIFAVTVMAQRWA